MAASKLRFRILVLHAMIGKTRNVIVSKFSNTVAVKEATHRYNSITHLVQ